MNNTKLTSLALIVIKCLKPIAAHYVTKDILGTKYLDFLREFEFIVSNRIDQERRSVEFLILVEKELNKLEGFASLLDSDQPFLPPSSNQSKDLIRILRLVGEIDSVADEFSELETIEQGWITM